MNKKMFTYALVTVGALALIGTSAVWASERPQRKNFNPESFSCNGECNFDEEGDCGCMKTSIQNRFKSMRDGLSGGDLEVKARALGMSLEDLEAQLESGKTFHELVQSAGIDQDEMQERSKDVLRSKVSERLNSAVEAGLISQEEAENKLNNLGQKQRIERNFNRKAGQDRGLGCGCQK